MKVHITFLLTIIISFTIYSQELTQEEKQRIIDSLDSNNNRENYNALLNVEKYNIIEAIPKLESKAQNGDCTAIYLRLLQKLGSSNVQSLAHIAIDSSNKCYVPIETRYDCSKILIESGDYSTSEFVIDFYNAKASKFFFDITLIPKIIDNRPDLLQQAKPIVFDYAQNFRGSPFTRYLANAIIAEKYPNEAVQVLVNSFKNEPDDATRILSLWLLFVIDYPGLPELMKERLIQEPIPSYRYIIADSLLKEFGTIENYQNINNYLSSEQDTVTRSLVNHKLETFNPIKPDSNQTIQLLIENIISIIDNCFNYTWLGDIQFKDELQSIIQSAQSNLLAGDSLACAVQVKDFQDNVDFVYKDSLNADPRFVTLEGWKFLYWNAQYILDRLPEIQEGENVSTYSIFATHGVWLEQNSELITGSIGVNEIGMPPFMDSDVELSIGISTETPAGYTIKANRIKVKQGATVNSDVYYNELENNGTITGSLNTPLELPLFAALPEFKTSTPGTQNITVAQNGVQTLQPGSYNNIDVKRYGKLIFTGGEYHINKLSAGDDNQLLFQSGSEVRIKDKFDSGQGTYIGPEDTTTLSADEIVFYVEGINGNNGNLGATPKAAKVGISNTVKANFYVPNGTLWIRQNSKAEGSFIGKDVDVGIGVKVRLRSTF